MARRGVFEFGQEDIVTCESYAEIAMPGQGIFYNTPISVTRRMSSSDFYANLIDTFRAQDRQIGILTAFHHDPANFIFAWQHGNIVVLIDPTGRLQEADMPSTPAYRTYLHTTPFYWQAPQVIETNPSKLTNESGQFCIMIATLFSVLTLENITACLQDNEFNLTRAIGIASRDASLRPLCDALIPCISTYTLDMDKKYESCLRKFNDQVQAGRAAHGAERPAAERPMLVAASGAARPMPHVVTSPAATPLPVAVPPAVIPPPVASPLAVTPLPAASPLATTPTSAAAATLSHHLPSSAETAPSKKRPSSASEESKPPAKRSPARPIENLDDYIHVLYKQVTGHTDIPDDTLKKLRIAGKNFFKTHPLTEEHLLKMINYRDLKSLTFQHYKDFRNWERLFKKQSALSSMTVFTRASPIWKQWDTTLTSSLDYNFIPGDFYPNSLTHRLYKLLDIGIVARKNFINTGELTIGLMVPIEAILQTIISIIKEDAERQHRLFKRESDFCSLQFRVYEYLIDKNKSGFLSPQPDELNLDVVANLCSQWGSTAAKIDEKIKNEKAAYEASVARATASFRAY